MFAEKMLDMSEDFVRKTVEPHRTNKYKYLKYLLVFVRKESAKELVGAHETERIFMAERIKSKMSEKREELEMIALELERYEKRRALAAAKSP